MPRSPVDEPTAVSEQPAATPRSSGKVPRATTAPPEVDPEQALWRAQKSFHTLIQISPDLVVLHRKGQIAWANPAVARAIGMPSGDELVGTPLIELFHAEDRNTVAARVMSPEASAGSEMFGLRWRRTKGGYRTTEAVAAVVDFEGADAVLIVARDVTERVEFQHQLLQRDRMAALG